MALKFLNNGYFAGTVGIGTESPYNKTHIKTSVDGDGLLLDYAGSNNKYVGVFFKIDNNTSDAYKKGALVWERTGSYNEGRFHFLLNNDDNASNVDLTDSKVTILSTGNVGIGTTSPGALLEISGIRENQIRLTSYDTTAAVDETIGGIEFYSSDAGNEGVKASISAIAANTEGSAYMTFSTGTNTEKMRITSSGNVGIGTTSPGATLELNSDTGNAAKLKIGRQNGATNYLELGTSGGSSVINAIGISGVNASLIFNRSTTTATTQSMIIDGSGNVGIGTTAPGDKLEIGNLTNYTGLTVKGAGASRPAVTFKNVSQSLLGAIYGTENRGMIIETGGNGTNGTVALTLSSAGALKLNTYTAGTLVSDASGNITVSSGGGAGGPYLPLAGGTMTGNLNINTSTNFPLLLTGTNTNYTAIGIRNTGSGDAGIYMDGINGDFGGSDYAFIGQKDEGYLLYNIGSSSPLPYHVFTGGNVGIGTTNPVSKFEVDGSIKVTGITSNIGAAAGLSLSYDSGINYINTWGSTPLITSTYNYQAFHISGSEKMRVHTNGNVGIGTTSPTAKLQVAGTTTYNSDAAQALRVCDATDVSKGIHIGFDTVVNAGIIQAGDFGVAYGNLSLNPNAGNVGIGTTSPNNKLDVNGDVFINSNYTANVAAQDLTIGKTTTGDHGLTIVTGNANTASIFFGDNNNNDAGMLKYQHSSNSMQFVTNRSEKMRIASNGNVGIGVTGPNQRLQVQTATTTDSSFQGINVHNNGTTGTRAGICFQGYDWVQSAIWHGRGMTPTSESGALVFGTNPNTTDLTVSGVVARMVINNAGAIKFNAYGAGTLVTDASGNITVSSGGGAGGPYLPLAGGTMTGTNGVLMPDNFKLKFGDATTPDLEIFHNGSNSYVRDSGTGGLVLEGSTMLELKARSGELYLRGNENSSVQLYHNNNLKLYTANTGVAVTGDINIDSALLSNQENTDVDTGTETVASVAIATYTAAFFDFVIKKGLNVRSGTVYACHDGDTTPLVQFTETSTQDLGNTSDVTLSVDISGGNMRLRATTTSDDWSVKSLIRAI